MPALNHYYLLEDVCLPRTVSLTLSIQFVAYGTLIIFKHV